MSVMELSAGREDALRTSILPTRTGEALNGPAAAVAQQALTV
jgi:hypothetical protein